MPKRKCLVLIKYDGLVHEKYILKSLDNEGERIKSRYISKLPREKVEKLYAEHEGKKFYPWLVEDLTDNPASVHVYEGDDVVKKIKDKIGPTDPSKAELDQVRSLSKDSLEKAIKGKRAVRNIIHASDKEKVNYEIELFFPDLS